MKRSNIIKGLCFAAIISIVLLSFKETSITQAINGRSRIVRMPVYVKAIEFVARHYEYERLTKEITAGSASEKEKALAIFRWTHDKIRHVPEGMPIVDDHVLNIIIRGYGSCDQSQDVFTTLAAYAGMDAFWAKVYDPSGKIWYPVSFVKISGRWSPFDTYFGKYFLNSDKEIASVEDISRDKSIVGGPEVDSMTFRGVPYKEFFCNLKPVTVSKTLRPEKQMPLKRLIFEIKKRLKIEKVEGGYEDK